MKYLILTEKPDAAKNFANALGGFSGFLPNSTDSYDIVASHGHLLEFKEPDKMVSPQLVEKYKDWTSLDNFPWNPSELNWDKKVIKGSQPTLDNIKKAATGHDAIIIATDDDPSGEGDVLAVEIINKIGWQKKVYRARFADESAKNIQKALQSIKDVTNQNEYGAYQAGESRGRFDLLSMQLSRIALIVERSAGYNTPTQKLGRLKSVIVGLVKYQLDLREQYVKKPYYEIKFKDKAGHVFSDKNADRFADKQMLTLSDFQPSDIEIYSTENKRQAPPQLLNLSYLSVAAGRLGFTSKQVTSTYQKMYIDGVVSYPRTADKKITQEQFDEILPYAPKIAQVVGVDESLLTQSTCRPKYLTKVADHGANRPGTNVPLSLDDVEAEYGACGRAIYDILAHSFLAILGDDYCYQQITARLKDYPKYTGTIKKPIALGFKAIINFNQEEPDSDNDPTAKSISTFDTAAMPFIYQGSNPKPQEPGHLFVINYLNKKGIGTGATQEETLGIITTGKHKLLNNVNDKYTLTDLGLIQATISKGTLIASPKLTTLLQSRLSQVKKREIPMMAVPRTMAKIVDHDKQVMLNNQAKLDKIVALQFAKKAWAKAQKNFNVPKVSGKWKDREVQIKTKWGDHTFTEAELTQLFADQTIKVSSHGKEVSGKLKEQTYNGHTFVGFSVNKEDNEDYITGIFKPTNKEVTFKKTFGNHIYTDQEANQLLAGNTIKFSATSKSGKPYEVKGRLEAYRYKGKRCFGFVILMEKDEFDK